MLRRILKSMAIIATLTVGTAQAALMTPTIDGNVQGFAEGYAIGFDATFNVESGPTGVTGGKLFYSDTPDKFYVGMVIPLVIDDNTYSTNKALDWGSIDHFLMGGGNGLEGSDKWVFALSIGGNSIVIKLDYIYADKETGAFNTRIEKFELLDKTKLDQSLLEYQSSLSYNYNVLGLTQYFDANKNNPIASPVALDVFYDFLSPAEAWLPEMMFEFSLDKTAFAGALDVDAFLANTGDFHFSPNKLGGHMVTDGLIVITTTSVPEPSTLYVFAFGLAGLGFFMRRRRAA